jgi:hypothetical protein
LAALTPLVDAIGYGLGSQIPLTAIGSFAISPGDTLLRYTLEGDANLDLKVDISDLGILASNWQGGGKVWSQADFNYDSLVNVVDLGSLATNWQQAASPIAARSAMKQRILDDVLGETVTESAEGLRSRPR